MALEPTENPLGTSVAEIPRAVKSGARSKRGPKYTTLWENTPAAERWFSHAAQAVLGRPVVCVYNGTQPRTGGSVSVTLSPPAIHVVSKGTLRITTTVSASAALGPAQLTATASGADGLPVGLSSVPVALTVGAQRQAVTLLLAFTAGDPRAPHRLSSSGVDLQLTQAHGPVVATAHADYVRDWQRDMAALRPGDLDRLPFAAAPVVAEVLRSAYDGDEGGGLLFARRADGATVGLVIQAGTNAEVVRWYDYRDPPAADGLRPARPGYTIPSGGRVDLFTGRGLPAAAAAATIWERAGSGPLMQLRPPVGMQLATFHTPIMLPLAATRVFAAGNPRAGTGRQWDEIRDLFDNCDEVPYRAGLCVDTVWGAAGIEFRVVVRRDIRIPDNWAHELPAPALRDFSQAHNVPGLLNVYFFRSVEGARAWGAADRHPGARGQNGALWVGDRCAADPSAACWADDVITLAHEAGHFLTLNHRCDDSAAGPPCTPADATYLMYGDGTNPDSRGLTAAEVARARRRAWAYRP